jgi:SAM-dependent methyltransferase
MVCVNALHHWFCRSEAWGRTVRGEILPWVLDGVTLGDRVLELGPGPGLTTDVLRKRAQQVTALEVDPRLAESLARRLAGAGVEVVRGDASVMPFEDSLFSGACCFTMLHHVPTRELQDRIFREVRRVLRPDTWFVGSDSRASLLFRLFHVNDTMTLVDPSTLAARLEKAGFADVEVELSSHRFRFRARRP